jgi:hypothetical protein
MARHTRFVKSFPNNQKRLGNAAGGKDDFYGALQINKNWRRKREQCSRQTPPFYELEPARERGIRGGVSSIARPLKRSVLAVLPAKTGLPMPSINLNLLDETLQALINES